MELPAAHVHRETERRAGASDAGSPQAGTSVTGDLGECRSIGHRELHELFAHVAPVQHPDEGARRILDAVHDILAIFELAGPQPFQ